MNASHLLLATIVVLCLLCGHCNLAKPTGSMTRIQEVFRTLMAKPMMLASRGKKSLVAFPNVEEYLIDRENQEDGKGRSGRRSFSDSSYWLLTDVRSPVYAVTLNVRR
ncbi:unnamed protein product [Meloidogyne enterolobii]|uniref:Uncharacterized protein n=2 Tax=Meloidogyne enterolobii TaxID=390850 RepID=A0ACB1AGV7_MELEN|nr:unnamed protein product [Meloidogyne enterolobii]